MPANIYSGYPTDEPSSYETVRFELIELYVEYAPHKLKNVDKMLHKYAGKELQMLEAARAKYGVQVESTTTLTKNFRGKPETKNENGDLGYGEAAPDTNNKYGYGDSTPTMPTPSSSRSRQRRNSIGSPESSYRSSRHLSSGDTRHRGSEHRRSSRRSSIGAANAERHGREHKPVRSNSAGSGRARRRASISDGVPQRRSLRRASIHQAIDTSLDRSKHSHTREHGRDPTRPQHRGSIGAPNVQRRRGSMTTSMRQNESIEDDAPKRTWDLKVGSLDQAGLVERVTLRF